MEAQSPLKSSTKIAFETANEVPKNYSRSPIHFISGLPRSGSTLLAAILRQNSRFQAGMTSPVGSLVSRMLEGMAEAQEYSVLISPQQKRELILSVFSAYYHQQIDNRQVIFDTNRLWCSKLPLLNELLPQAKFICCVRNVAWVMDSIERLVRRNAFDVSKMFNRGEAATVYSRTEALSQGNRLVGFAYNALREAFYGEEAAKLLVVDYELLTSDPAQTLGLIYQFIDEPYFPHNFEQVEYDEPKFDCQLNTKGLHKVRPKVEFQPRRTILPPDLFERFNALSFWHDTTGSLANVIAINNQQVLNTQEQDHV